jgi:hypothetical protein
VGSASEASREEGRRKKEPHPGLPETGEGKDLIARKIIQNIKIDQNM